MLFGAKPAPASAYRKTQWDWQIERLGLNKAGK